MQSPKSVTKETEDVLENIWLTVETKLGPCMEIPLTKNSNIVLVEAAVADNSTVSLLQTIFPMADEVKLTGPWAPPKEMVIVLVSAETVP